MKWKIGIIWTILLLEVVSSQQPHRRKLLRRRNPEGKKRSQPPGNSAGEEVTAADESQGQFQSIQGNGLDQTRLPLQTLHGISPGPDGAFGLRTTQDAYRSSLVQQAPGAQLQIAAATLPNLPAGHHYVDEYGRPLVLAQDQVRSAQTAPQQPQPAVTQVATNAPQAPHVNTSGPQLFVDQYGRQFIQIQPQPHAHGLTQVVTQPLTTLAHAPAVITRPQQVVHGHSSVVNHSQAVATHQVHHAVPLVHHGASALVQQEVHHAVPVVHHAAPAIVQQEVHHTLPLVHHAAPALVHQEVRHAVPVVQQTAEVHHAVPVVQHVAKPLPLLQKAPPPVTLQTYAVPAVRQVGNLLIPYAAKVTLAPGKTLPNALTAAIVTKAKQRAAVASDAVVTAEIPVSAIATEINAAASSTVEKQAGHSNVNGHKDQSTQAQTPIGVSILPHPAVIPVAPHVPVATLEQHHVLPTVVKQLNHVPDFTVIHQPVLSKPLFQKHIFNIKHGSEPTVFQDLCTVYPYQKNIPACVLKKALLPELHHPDIRTVNVENPTTPLPTDPSLGAGSAIVIPSDFSRRRQQIAVNNPPTTMVVQISNTAPPPNIQAVIQTAKMNAVAMATATQPSVTTTTTAKQPDTTEPRIPSASTDCEGSRKKKKCASKPVETDDGDFKIV